MSSEAPRLLRAMPAPAIEPWTPPPAGYAPADPPSWWMTGARSSTCSTTCRAAARPNRASSARGSGSELTTVPVASSSVTRPPEGVRQRQGQRLLALVVGVVERRLSPAFMNSQLKDDPQGGQPHGLPPQLGPVTADTPLSAIAATDGAGCRDDGRDTLSVPRPRPAGHRGSRGAGAPSRTRSVARPRAWPSDTLTGGRVRRLARPAAPRPPPPALAARPGRP